jgi:predicted nuclease of predicted toxin-antitoxin system
MLRLASDADVHGDVVRGLRRHAPALDLVRAHEVGLRTAEDPSILAWAAQEGRVLLTQDRNTMVGYAYERVTAGQPMPGVIVLTERQAIGDAIQDILLLAECYTADEIKDRVVFLPYRGG